MSEPTPQRIEAVRIAPPPDPVADKAHALRALGLPADATDLDFLQAASRSHLVPPGARRAMRQTIRQMRKQAERRRPEAEGK